MDLDYAPFTPQHLRYRHCPMCTSRLTAWHDADGLFRARCTGCSWVYHPPNLYGAGAVVTTPDGLVFLLPPEEPVDAPAALPAGISEFGESPEETAVREVREETGLEVEVVREHGHWLDRDLPFGPMLEFFFETRMVGGTLRDGLEGWAAVFGEDELPAISPKPEGSRRTLTDYLGSAQYTAQLFLTGHPQGVPLRADHARTLHTPGSPPRVKLRGVYLIEEH